LTAAVPFLWWPAGLFQTTRKKRQRSRRRDRRLKAPVAHFSFHKDVLFLKKDAWKGSPQIKTCPALLYVKGSNRRFIHKKTIFPLKDMVDTIFYYYLNVKEEDLIPKEERNSWKICWRRLDRRLGSHGLWPRKEQKKGSTAQSLPSSLSTVVPFFC
jgi:hypothetical protein